MGVPEPAMHKFPDNGMELTHILVVEDLDRAGGSIATCSARTSSGSTAAPRP